MSDFLDQWHPVSLFPDGKGGRPGRQGAVLAAGAAALPLLSYVMGGC